jgi:hypothetical protein
MTPAIDEALFAGIQIPARNPVRFPFPCPGKAIALVNLAALRDAALQFP